MQLASSPVHSLAPNSNYTHTQNAETHSLSQLPLTTTGDNNPHYNNQTNNPTSAHLSIQKAKDNVIELQEKIQQRTRLIAKIEEYLPKFKKCIQTEEHTKFIGNFTQLKDAIANPDNKNFNEQLESLYTSLNEELQDCR